MSVQPLMPSSVLMTVSQILAQSGLQATSFRIGQITGGQPNGSWATSDWVPIFVKSSLRLGALPSAVGVSSLVPSNVLKLSCLLLKLSSWLPMHAVSQTLLDIAFLVQSPPPALNIVHPRPVSWNYIISSISQALVQEGVTPTKLPFDDFQSWFFQLESRSADASEKDIQELVSLCDLSISLCSSSFSSLQSNCWSSSGA